MVNRQTLEINQFKKPQEWRTIGVRVRNTELSLLNRQLDRLNYTTLGDLVKDLIAGKITRLTDDQQIDIMKTNLQINGQITGISGKPYDFYKQIDMEDGDSTISRQCRLCPCADNAFAHGSFVFCEFSL